MEIATCPHCHCKVVLTPNGSCPSCQEPVASYTEAAQASVKPLFGDGNAAFSEQPSEIAGSNPYQSPMFTDENNFDHTGRINGGILWILFSFEGRIPRRIFWSASIITSVIFYVVMFALIEVFGPQSDLATVGILVLYVPMLWTSLAITVKRWHDRDKSGWWILIGFIPIIGPLWQFVETGCLRGTMGSNQYGPDPT